ALDPRLIATLRADVMIGSEFHAHADLPEALRGAPPLTPVLADDAAGGMAGTGEAGTGEAGTGEAGTHPTAARDVAQ
ncbi:MAG: hypothetical protein AAFR46_14900, partial [Pseudomonadota bacterium]